MRPILALCACLAVAAGLAACGGVGSDSVAVMAGNPISKKAFDHWIYVAAKGSSQQSPGAPVIVPDDPPDFKNCIAQVRRQIPSLAKIPDKQLKTDCNQLFQSLSSQVMDFLIRAYWYQAEAAKRHITISDTQVQQALQTDKKQQFPSDAAFNQFLAQSGQTMQDILFRVRINQLLKKLLAQHNTTITPATIQAYYRSHGSQFGKPAMRNIRIVRTNSQAQANAARAALNSGQSWQTVAQRFSIDTQTKQKGGLLVGVTKGQEEQALDNAAFSAPLNKVMGPVHGTFGWYVFSVTKITPGNQQSLAKATPLIRQILQSQSQQTAQTSLDNQVKKDWLSKTQCASAFKMNDCSGFKASSSSSSSLSPGAAQSSGAAPQSSAAPPATSQAPSTSSQSTK